MFIRLEVLLLERYERFFGYPRVFSIIDNSNMDYMTLASMSAVRYSHTHRHHGFHSKMIE